MNKQTVKDIDLKGKKVIVRVDFNVPLDDQCQITDDRRIREALDTIRYILNQKVAKVILMSHLGRPEGQVIEKMRLAPVAKRLSELLGQPVLALKDCIGPEVKKAIDTCRENIVLLENLRFHKEETKNDPQFAKKLASLADVYVNDAFGSAHRAHASTEGIAHHLPAVAGFLLEKEIAYLGKAVQNPERQLVVILGGAKVSDKIMLIENIMGKANSILIGGGMAYTFMKAQGKSIGKSLLEADKVETAKKILAQAAKSKVQIVLSEDFFIVRDFKNSKEGKIGDQIPDDWQGVDIGPKTIEKFKAVLSKAKTVIWNGPVGVFEIDAYAKGTKAIAEFLVKQKGK